MVNGIINVYKEKGFTSFDVVAKMRGIFHQKKIGHTGTLDPDAEGVLPVCLGKATKVCELLTDKDKEYRAVLLLGKETDTQDITGEVIHESPVNVSEEEVRRVIESFIGSYEQLPPMYSALKVNGQKLCDLARKGITVERKARKITIFDIRILDIQLPEVTFSVHCSKGTYIRTLCKDIGDKLGCFGCMKSLVRTRVMHFCLENAITLSELSKLVESGTSPSVYLTEVDSLFLDYPRAVAKKEAQKLLENGNRIPAVMVDYDIQQSLSNGCSLRLYTDEGQFVGIFSYQEKENDFKPIKIFME